MWLLYSAVIQKTKMVYIRVNAWAKKMFQSVWAKVPPKAELETKLTCEYIAQEHKPREHTQGSGTKARMGAEAFDHPLLGWPLSGLLG